MPDSPASDRTPLLTGALHRPAAASSHPGGGASASSDISANDLTTAADGECMNDDDASAGLLACVATDTSRRSSADPATDPIEDARLRALAADTRIPPAVAFIVGNEFCERFTFYGIKAILYIYLTRYLRVASASATALVHAFNMFAYTATVFGGWLSDSHWGKFKTIVVLSLVYCCGNLVLSATAIPGVMPIDPVSGSPSVLGAVFGLGLLALGTGGIKPCVAAFGGDQFHPSQTSAITIYFSMFYFAINSGSLFSMVMTPLLRSQKCFGRDDCFPLAFGTPSLLMLVSTMIFVSGRRWYKVRPADGNVLARVWDAIKAARVERARATQRGEPIKSHWIEYASADPLFAGQEGARFLGDVRQLLRVVWVFLPLPIFWTLYDQQSSRWTSQALLMQHEVKLPFGLPEISVKPDQMQVTNALLILAFIPLFARVIYPSAHWLRDHPLRRMAIGMVLVGFSFVMASLLQWRIDGATYVAWDKAAGTMREVTSLAERASLAEIEQLKCVKGCVSVLWQVPQYIVITAGEILFSPTGLEFAFTHAPASMKSVCQSAWQLTTAVGNLLVIVVAESRLMDAAPELMFFAFCLFFAAGVFYFMSRGFAEHEADRCVSPAPGDSELEETVL
ncbi:POT family-domain-containing protein [Blastocladiella britannica]|nr:POT family-domain-containing protein [Blastocladiella britannica]